MDKLLETDGKGRLTLGAKYAHLRFIVEDKDGDIILKKIAVVPEKELWLYQNPKAYASVKRGLEQAKKGELQSSPSILTK